MGKGKNFFHIVDKMKKNRQNATNKKSDPHQHSALIFKGNKSVNVLSFGYNHVRHNNCALGHHAETHALSKLMRKNIKGKFNIVIVRNNYTNSKPCANCLKHFEMYKKYGINIRKVYYSDNNELVKTTVSTLSNSKCHHESKFFKTLDCEEEEDVDQDLGQLSYLDMG